MFSAASKLNAGMVDWKSVLKGADLFHTSGITFGLAEHSQYSENYCLNAFLEAVAAKPPSCMVGLDFNYRGTLWSPDKAARVMNPILTDHVDLLITTIEDMAKLYAIDLSKYSAQQIVDGELGQIDDEDIRVFAQQILDKFKVKLVAITIRYPDTFEVHRWESAVVDSEGFFFRSPEVHNITLMDRLGGGDTWNAGFYYGLLTEGLTQAGIRKGVLVGDAATRLKQTIMFDLPIINRDEVQALLKADIQGGGKRTER
jgi:2-dehydro-3-deoxygluconokinase